jgi:ubiquitin-like protein Pup
MSDRERGQAENRRQPDGEEQSTGAAETEADLDALDDLLDEIDEVLEENAEEFVKNYVQKGGQ